MNYNVIINLAYSFDEEQINKIIKIQATIRGMEMRDKIKLKSKKKKQKEEEEIIKTDGNNINNGEFIYENKIKKEIKENDICFNIPIIILSFIGLFGGLFKL